MKQIFLFLLLAPLLTHAKDTDPCTKIDLVHGGPLEKVPVSDQNKSPTCFAHGASVLAQAYLSRWPGEKAPSPEELEKKIADGNKWVLNVNNGRTCSSVQLAQKSAGKIPGCENFGFRGAKGRTLRAPKELLARIHQLLEKKQPAGIEYCSGVLKANGTFITKRSFRKDLNYLADEKEVLENFSEKCGFHVSVVSARERRDDGRCYLQIQNSWGTSCDRYPADIRPCEGGRIWVPEEELGKNLFRVVSLKEK